MYGDRITDSMGKAINETNRRRKIQMEYNKEHGIIPTTIVKPVHDIIEATKTAEEKEYYNIKGENIDELIEKLKAEMTEAAANLQFERAAELRDEIKFIMDKRDGRERS